MNPVDLVLVLAFAVVWPAYSARFGRAALREAVEAGAAGARRAEYGSTMLMLWTFAALAAAAALERGRSAAELRLLPPTGVGLALGILAVALVLVLLALQSRVGRSAAGRAAVRRQLEPLVWFLPHDAADRALFRPLSVTAGICEEWLCRGYLLAVLTPPCGIFGAVAISSALFGLAHGYQGLLGVVRTGLVGLLLAGVVWATGSLWPTILIHAVADWMQGDLIVRALGEEPVGAAA